jgi:hypothetical protein
MVLGQLLDKGLVHGDVLLLCRGRSDPEFLLRGYKLLLVLLLLMISLVFIKLNSLLLLSHTGLGKARSFIPLFYSL